MDPRERIAFLKGPAGERALLARLVAGDDQAYRECYELHAPGIMRVLVRVLGDRTQAEDVIQETFVAAFGAIGTFRQEAGLSSWLTAIALRRALNVRRGESRRLRNLPPAPEAPADTTTRQLIGRNLTGKVLAILDDGAAQAAGAPAAGRATRRPRSPRDRRAPRYGAVTPGPRAGRAGRARGRRRPR